MHMLLQRVWVVFIQAVSGRITFPAGCDSWDLQGIKGSVVWIRLDLDLVDGWSTPHVKSITCTLYYMYTLLHVHSVTCTFHFMYNLLRVHSITLHAHSITIHVHSITSTLCNMHIPIHVNSVTCTLYYTYTLLHVKSITHAL